ncbi:MAG: dockerin type I domain-containing protein [Acidobacteriota bacterium]
MKKSLLWIGLFSLMLLVAGPAAAKCIVDNDLDNSGDVTFDDAKLLFNYLFASGPAPTCMGEADANGDGTVTIADVIVILDAVACSDATLGDVNGSGVVALADVNYLLNYLFLGGPEPQPCLEVGDVNGDGSLSIADAVALGGSLPCPGVPGDVNGDEQVDISDLILVAESFSTSVTFVPCTLAGDLNQDGTFNIADLIAYFDLF